MSTFDPASIRQAVADFTPRRPQRFQQLIPAKDVIIELRQKKASYGAIADLLTQHCLPTSKTAVAAFCHQILGEITRPKRRLSRKRGLTAQETNGHELQPSNVSPPTSTSSAEPGTLAETSEPNQIRPRGPRIAQVRMTRAS